MWSNLIPQATIYHTCPLRSNYAIDPLCTIRVQNPFTVSPKNACMIPKLFIETHITMTDCQNFLAAVQATGASYFVVKFSMDSSNSSKHAWLSSPQLVTYNWWFLHCSLDRWLSANKASIVDKGESKPPLKTKKYENTFHPYCQSLRRKTTSLSWGLVRNHPWTLSPGQQKAISVISQANSSSQWAVTQQRALSAIFQACSRFKWTTYLWKTHSKGIS